MIGHNLHHTMPNGITHIITTNGNQLQNCIHIPTQICSILFRQNSNLEYHLLTNTSIRHNQMCHQLIHNTFRIIRITNHKQQIQRPSSYTNIRILQRHQHGSLMLLRPLHTPINLRKLRHGRQSQIPNIGFTHGYEFSQNIHCPLSHFWRAGCPPGDNQIDRFKENGVIGIGFVDGIGHLRFKHDTSDDIDELTDMIIAPHSDIMTLNRIRVELQKFE
mmetsp:Transcript_29564/g.45750  ORF Transcript_29564/g.45750 Transcript_29564/m.45750 type:complete len:218 (+) Transcript_29564:1605-2258(+)